MVRVSIIVPIYNVERYLEKCLSSLLDQTYKNIEIIMVDDCSTDHSGKIARVYAEKNTDRMKFIQRTSNGMLSATRNTGIEKATGEYLTFVDSDDWVEKNYIQRLVEEAVRTDADIVACGYQHVYANENIEPIDTFGFLSTDAPHRQKVAFLRNHACTRLYKTSFFKECQCPFPENIERAAELGTTVPLLTKTERISIINEALYNYYQRKNSNSLSNTKRRSIQYMYQVFNVIHQRCEVGFEKEIEYREIMEFVYGITSVMIKSGYTYSEVKKCLKKFTREHPQWKQNPYLTASPRGKQIYIQFAMQNQVIMMILLVKGYQALKKVRKK